MTVMTCISVCSVKQQGLYQRSGNPWPPFRIPALPNTAYLGMNKLLHCRTLHGMLFTLLYKVCRDYPRRKVPSSISWSLYIHGAAIKKTPLHNVHYRHHGFEISCQIFGMFPEIVHRLQYWFYLLHFSTSDKMEV